MVLRFGELTHDEVLNMVGVLILIHEDVMEDPLVIPENFRMLAEEQAAVDKTVTKEEFQDSVVLESEPIVVPVVSNPVVAEPVEAKPVEAKPVEAQPSAPVFKVQILASSSKIKAGDARLQGQKDADFYLDGGLYKYTVGASEDYDEIYRLRKEVAQKFPEAFIVAFKDGSRMNVNEAIKEFRSKKVKK